MCNRCLQGLWCLDEQKQYDNFFKGFIPKQRQPMAAVVQVSAAPKTAPPPSQLQPDASKSSS